MSSPRPAPPVRSRLTRSWLARLAVAVALPLATTAAVGTAVAAGGVQETTPVCREAHAILAGGNDGEHARRWEAVSRVVRKNRKWTVIDAPERDTVDRIAFRQWRAAHPCKGCPETYYVAHCGHGGTCNAVARAYVEAYPSSSPPPVVFCGETANVLTDPQPVSLP